jgi:hypothetical protein
VVAAVLLLAAIAAADAVRRADSGREALRPVPLEAAPAPVLAADGAHGFAAAADGRLTRTRVVRYGQEVLSENQVDNAFRVPLEESGTFDIAHLAVAPDGTLALAVYEFAGSGNVHAGIELWQGKRLIGSFGVPPGSFAGGIGFSPDGELVAAFERGRRQATLFDRSGRREADVPLG